MLFGTDNPKKTHTQNSQGTNDFVYFFRNHYVYETCVLNIIDQTHQCFVFLFGCQQ